MPAPTEIERNPLEASPTETAQVDALEAEPATPDETAPLPPKPFAEELPPDFWGDEIELPDVPQTPQNAPEETFSEAGAAPSRAASKSPSTNATDLSGEGIEADPRFALLQSLFPGFISEWQPAQTPATNAETALEDAPETPETVDLEEGLDADESDEES